MECTLSIIKPDIVKKNMIGNIYTRLEQAGFKIIAAKMLCLTKVRARKFYSEHSQKSFFPELINFMISGPIMLQVLTGHNVIKNYRDLMGNTNPDKALKGTLRADFANSITENAIHGSDSIESARYEISFFFDKNEIFMF
uniref:Nucleoside diphosphate kinase n=1 Tax=Candidatus Aschnera chinzeii TaxID=1485666 RepID=A0AAT9G548_9ENTR|nr:MAG: nucleoside-diphosphate kinase [Candidatus Aschnera chinzeii]